MNIDDLIKKTDEALKVIRGNRSNTEEFAKETHEMIENSKVSEKEENAPQNNEVSDQAKIQEEVDSTEKEPSFGEKYYDKIDRQHAEILEKCACMCRSNKHGFTVTDRLEAIRELLEGSGYKEIFLGTTSMWFKEGFNKKEDTILISSHADTVDTISKCYSRLSEEGYYSGTYDNAGTNAAAVIAMLEGNFPPNVVFAFNSEEESGKMKGAKDCVSYLTSIGISKPTCIALDVTYEGHDEGLLASIENCSKDPNFLSMVAKSALSCEPQDQSFIFVKKSNKALPEELPKEFISPSTGMCDEAFIYADLGMNTFSFCLPCEGNMHSDSGLRVRQPAFEGYVTSLETMIYAMTKTHPDLITAKIIEKQALLDRNKELMKTEVPKTYHLPGYYSATPGIYSGYNRSSDYMMGYDDDYNFGSINDADYNDDMLSYYGHDVEFLESVAYDMLDSEMYDESEKNMFIQDAIASACPELTEQLKILSNYFSDLFDQYQEYMENQEEEQDSPEDYYQGYIDDL